VVTPLHLLEAGWPTLSEKLAELLQKDAPPAPDMEPVFLTLLPELGREMTAEAPKFPIIGRDREIDELAGTLLKCFKPNALLVGEPGVGKTALVEALATRIREGRVPPALKGARIFEIPVSALLAGAGAFGSLEERMRDLIREAESTPGIILFLDEIHQLPAKGSGLADILKPALARGHFRCIGATTPAEFHRTLEGDGALTRRFELVRVSEPDRAAVLAILEGLRGPMEVHSGVDVPDGMAELIYDLAADFLPQLYFPDKAVDVLDRALTAAEQAGVPTLEARFVRDTVAHLAGVAFTEDSPEFRSRLDTLEAALGSEILGQEEAVRSISAIVRLAKGRIDLRPERPDGVFLLLGPSGVGKSAIAEALARQLTGRDDALIRVDMSELTEPHSVARLIGSPAGYIGYGEQSALLAGLRRSPSGVLLLDEIEKAHANVHRLFLQVFDSGRLTDATGQTYSLSHLTIVATANLAGASTAKTLGFTPPAATSGLELPWPLLKSVFPIELLNRFDEIVQLKPLSRETAREILRRCVLRAANRRLAGRGVQIELSPETEEAVLAEGYSLEFGVRHLQRAFEEKVLMPVSSMIGGSGKAQRLLLVGYANGAAMVTAKAGAAAV
jgi:ATP-dependent Clp protease ATP-binding subunit ClpC